MNLTAAREPALLRTAHVDDCLAALAEPLRAAADRGALRLLDLGAGGGLPGLPLACVEPRVHVTLVDATRKKVGALERIISRLGLPNASAIWGRAEVLAHDPAHRERYDVVTARAVAALPVLVQWAAGFVRVGGACWFLKTAAALESEEPAARQVAERCGLDPAATRAYALPGEAAGRVVVMYAKHRPTPRELPRRA